MPKILIALSFFVAILSSPHALMAGQANLVLDAGTGEVLASENADRLNHPASLTKMMTLYMTFEAIKRGKLSWDQPVRFSKYAASRPPTKLHVKAGDSVTVREAVMGMIIVSANDAASAMAETLGGSESAFCAQMTRRARALGLNKTVFVNASGLPDEQQVTTARDMAALGVALLRDFPQEYRLFATESFVFRGRTIRGHNNLMYRTAGMDGIKTGYTNASGFNLVSAVRQNGRRVIGVVLGGRTAASRDRTMATLLTKYAGAGSSGTAVVSAQSPNGTRLAALDDVGPVPVMRPNKDPISAIVAEANANGSVPVPSTRYQTAYNNGTADENPAFAALQKPRPPQPVLQAPTDGWQIQIAAATSRQAAMDILDRAKRTIGAPLAARQAYAEKVTRGGSTLYRARFSGFPSKNDARSACEQLVQKSYDCLLMPTQG